MERNVTMTHVYSGESHTVYKVEDENLVWYEVTDPYEVIAKDTQVLSEAVLFAKTQDALLKKVLDPEYTIQIYDERDAALMSMQMDEDGFNA